MQEFLLLCSEHTACQAYDLWSTRKLHARGVGHEVEEF